MTCQNQCASDLCPRQCQPLHSARRSLDIRGRNCIPVEVPAFLEAWLLELCKPFYVFQFLCCVRATALLTIILHIIIIFFECALLLQVLWTIDNYIPYGYGLMTLLLFGASQAASESPSPFSPTRMHVLLLCCITHHPMF